LHRRHKIIYKHIKQAAACVMCLLCFCLSSTPTHAQGKYDQQWSNEFFKLNMSQDSTFSFSKIDERVIDYNTGRWTVRKDTVICYTEDTFRIVQFMLYGEDSIHKRITHVDPGIYRTYGYDFPAYFYLNKMYHANGKLWKEYTFEHIKNHERPEVFTVNTYDGRGYLECSLSVDLRSNKAYYVAYYLGNGYPQVHIQGSYKHGIASGTWKYYDERTHSLIARKKGKDLTESAKQSGE